MNRVALVGQLVHDATAMRNGIAVRVAVQNDMGGVCDIPVYSFTVKSPDRFTKGKFVCIDAYIEIKTKDNVTKMFIVADSIKLVNDRVEQATKSFNERGAAHVR